MAEVEVLREELRECEVVIEGEFVQESAMADWGWSEYLAVLTRCLTQSKRKQSLFKPARTVRQRIQAVKAHCKSQPTKLLRPGLTTLHLHTLSPQARHL